MKIQDLIKVMWANKLTLTTKQLAEAYETTPHRIKDNFRRAKAYFVESEDYFKLEGDALRQFKEDLRAMSGERGCFSDPLATFLSANRALMLWTYKGCARHCKMINTQAAWDMFDELSRVYFGVIEGEIENPVEEKAVAVVQTPPDDSVDSLRRAQNQFARPCRDLAVVYAFLMSNFSVKIGYTKDINTRIRSLESETKLRVLDFKTTPFMPRDDAKLQFVIRNS